MGGGGDTAGSEVKRQYVSVASSCANELHSREIIMGKFTW